MTNNHNGDRFGSDSGMKRGQDYGQGRGGFYGPHNRNSERRHPERRNSGRPDISSGSPGGGGYSGPDHSRDDYSPNSNFGTGTVRGYERFYPHGADDNLRPSDLSYDEEFIGDDYPGTER